MVHHHHHHNSEPQAAVRHTSPFQATGGKGIALVILNSPILSPPSTLFRKLWKVSSFRVCADGGANRLYQSTVTDPAGESNDFLPDLIRGDLDSVLPEVRSFYEARGARIERDPDQNCNDLDKCLHAIKKSMSVSYVLIYGAFGGRFDQEMASMQALYKWSDAFEHLWLYDDNTCALLMKAGVRNEVRMWDVEGPTCGLIPLGCRCESVKTTGLRWNLDGKTPLEFGGLVSTSNHIEDGVVTVVCSHPLIFTAEIKSAMRNGRH